MRRNVNKRQKIPIWVGIGRFLVYSLFLLPFVLFLSYHPVIQLGSNRSMNFELSLPLIWLVIFDLLALIVLITLSFSGKNTKNSKTERFWGTNFPGISDRRIFLLTLFPFWATLSIFWSSNPLRGALTAGIVWLLWFAVFVIIYLVPLILPQMSKTSLLSAKPQNRSEAIRSVEVLSNQTLAQKTRKTSLPQAREVKNARQNTDFSIKRLKKALLVTFFATSVLIAAFCWLQAILDTVGANREDTLLCAGCTYRSFGFPHPSGFAIEPQFMGNLLLAPVLTSLYLLVWRKDKLQKKEFWLLAVSAIFLTATLFFTFSRGAIYAFGVALIILFVWALISSKQIKNSRGWLTLLTLPIVAFLIALFSQGLLADYGPTNETFGTGVAKSIHQLSLGIVDIRSLVDTMSDQATDPSNLNQKTGSLDVSESEEEAFFEGYVAESTDYRLLLNRVAWYTWRDNPKNMLIGVGLGAAGTAMHELFPTEVTSPKEIVQNEGFSILLELGVIGILFLIFEFLVIFCPSLFSAKFLDGRAATITKKEGFWAHPALPLLVSLIIAYLITLNFFSGLPNALQIYLFPPLLYLIFSLSSNSSKSTKLRTSRKPSQLS